MKKIIMTAALTVLTIPSAFAGHSWGGYHWASTTSPFDLTVVNSTTSDWDSYVSQATNDWSSSSVLNMVEVDGDTSSKSRRQCKPADGQVRICNLAYGYNGWLGIAGISVDTGGHITSGYTKLNDSYYGSGSYYDTFEWRQTVTCQELGHDIGLDHQDEDFNNESLFTCMDYQDPPYPYPDSHDFVELGIIYDHLDAYDSYLASGTGTGTDTGGDGGTCSAPAGKGCNKSTAAGNGAIGWGMSLGRHGNQENFLRIDPDGTRHLTHVIWTNEYVEKAGR